MGKRTKNENTSEQETGKVDFFYYEFVSFMLRCRGDNNLVMSDKKLTQIRNY